MNHHCDHDYEPDRFHGLAKIIRELYTRIDKALTDQLKIKSILSLVIGRVKKVEKNVDDKIDNIVYVSDSDTATPPEECKIWIQLDKDTKPGDTLVKQEELSKEIEKLVKKDELASYLEKHHPKQ